MRTRGLQRTWKCWGTLSRRIAASFRLDETSQISTPTPTRPQLPLRVRPQGGFFQWQRWRKPSVGVGLCGTLFPMGTFVACSSTLGLKSESQNGDVGGERWGLPGHHQVCHGRGGGCAGPAVKSRLMSSYGKSFFFLYSKRAHCCLSPLWAPPPPSSFSSIRYSHTESPLSLPPAKQPQLSQCHVSQPLIAITALSRLSQSPHPSCTEEPSTVPGSG